MSQQIRFYCKNALPSCRTTINARVSEKNARNYILFIHKQKNHCYEINFDSKSLFHSIYIVNVTANTFL